MYSSSPKLKMTHVHFTQIYICTCIEVTHAVRDTDKLTYSADVRTFPLLAYVDIPKENDGYFVLFHVGVASSIHDLHAGS